MSTYNGEKYIREQLDSLLTQTRTGLKVVIRDDGSKDKTIGIIEEYLCIHPNIKLIKGENLGYAKSFWWLLQNAPASDYYAFCDQDDIWMPEKIERAICVISEKADSNNTPVVYTSRVVSVDNEMNIISKNCFNNDRALNVYESFQKSAFPGCVFVFNDPARSIAIEYNGILESHDWALYAIVSLFGKVIFDDESHIKYRIHENNTIGKSNNFIVLYKKIIRFFKKSKCFRSSFAKDIYSTYSDLLEDELKKEIYKLAYYKEKKREKISLLLDKHFKGIVFKILVALNKV